VREFFREKGFKKGGIVMRRLPIIFIAIGLIIIGCGLFEVMAQETFKLGIPVPLSGTKKNFGELIRGGALIALEEINARGGFTKGVLRGKKLELSFEDTVGKPEKAEEIARKFITEDQYPIIIGAYSSSCSLAVAEVSAEHGIPYLCQTGSTDKLTQQGWKNVFRLNPSSSQYITGLNDFLVTVVKPKTMAILYEPTAYGKSLSEVMREFCAKKGIKIVYDEAYEPKQTDYKPMLIKVKHQKPDVIFMISYIMDAILLMKQARELDINPKIFSGGAAGFVVPEFPEGAGQAAEYVVTSALWAPGVKYPGAREFTEKFRARYGSEPTYHAVEGYALVYATVDALERTVSLSPEDIIAALKKTDMMTSFGPVKFEDFENFTNQNRIPTLLMQVQDGQLVTIWPKEAAETRYRYPVPKWSAR